MCKIYAYSVFLSSEKVHEGHASLAIRHLSSCYTFGALGLQCNESHHIVCVEQ